MAYNAAKVKAVTTVRATPEGYNILIEAEGMAAAQGWSQFALAPREYEEPPQDGVLDLDLVGQPPVDGGGDGPMDTGPVTLALDNPENFWSRGGLPLKGVRIHAEENQKDVPIP